MTTLRVFIATSWNSVDDNGEYIEYFMAAEDMGKLTSFFKNECSLSDIRSIVDVDVNIEIVD